MSKVFFIADTHFSEDKIIEYENRPFSSPEEMNESIITNWNKTVSPDDTVWHLGDFGADGHEQDFLNRLNGKIILVKGNHDNKSNEYYRLAGFDEVYDLPVLFNNFFILSHEPIYVNTNMPYANIFGHVHANPMFKDFSEHHFCACVERTNYAPVSMEQIIAKKF